PLDPLSPTPTPVTRIHWADGLTAALPVWQAEPEPGVPFAIHGNLVDAQHGIWRVARLRGDPTTRDDTQPDISLTPQSAIIVRSPVGVWQLRALRLLEGPQCFDFVDGELVPALEVTLGEPWFMQAHLEASRPFDRHFTAETDNDGR